MVDLEQDISPPAFPALGANYNEANSMKHDIPIQQESLAALDHGEHVIPSRA